MAIHTENSQVLILGELPGETAVRDVVQILEPLEVRDSYTTSVQIHVWNHENFLVKKDLVRLWRDRTVRAFADDFCLDFWSIICSDFLNIDSKKSARKKQ